MVPLLIHHITGPKINPFLSKCINSWKSLDYFGFAFRLWNDKKIERFLKKNHRFALPAFCNARNHAEAADIARYLIIYSYGGVYVDWDIQLLSPQKFVNFHLLYPSGYMLRDPFNNTLASEFFCAQKRDPFLLAVTHDIIELYNSNKRDYLNTPHYSGPYRMRDSLKEHPEVNMEICSVKDVFAYDYREIRDMPQREITQPMIHYWAHTWFGNL